AGILLLVKLTSCHNDVLAGQSDLDETRSCYNNKPMTTEPPKTSTDLRGRESPDPTSQLYSVLDEQSAGDFVNPDFEFDQFETELAAVSQMKVQRDSSPNQFAVFPLLNENEEDDSLGMMSPKEFVEEDYEAELGTAAREVTAQEALDVEYQDIARMGVIQVAGDDRLGRKVVVFSACRLPDYDKVDYQRLYDYIRRTLEQYVANDYSLVYFHYGLTNAKKPPLKWLTQAYRGFDRNFKKNLKALYIVHPTSLVLFIIKFFKPIISRKFGQKINFINELSELSADMHLDQIPIPQQGPVILIQAIQMQSYVAAEKSLYHKSTIVKYAHSYNFPLLLFCRYDADLIRQRSAVLPDDPYTQFKASQSGMPPVVSSNSTLKRPEKPPGPNQIFGVSLDL
ncbi:hypothetical protein ACTXT7_004840, partial [Hymenolepis weldensis]